MPSICTPAACLAPVQEFVADGLSVANSTIAAISEVEGLTLFIRQRAVDLELEQLLPGVLKVGGECGAHGVCC